MENIKENNTLIAEFMGAEITGNPILGEYDMYGVIDSIEDGHWVQHCFSPEEMLFYTDWNWIMPVVEKIEMELLPEDSFVTIEFKECYVTCHDGENSFDIYKVAQTKIEAVYNTVVEFIKWYNNQQTK